MEIEIITKLSEEESKMAESLFKKMTGIESYDYHTDFSNLLDLENNLFSALGSRSYENSNVNELKFNECVSEVVKLINKIKLEEIVSLEKIVNLKKNIFKNKEVGKNE